MCRSDTNYLFVLTLCVKTSLKSQICVSYFNSEDLSVIFLPRYFLVVFHIYWGKIYRFIVDEKYNVHIQFRSLDKVKMCSAFKSNTLVIIIHVVTTKYLKFFSRVLSFCMRSIDVFDVFFCHCVTFGANNAYNGIKTFVFKKDEQDEDALLRTGGDALATIEDRRGEGVTEHANNEPAGINSDSNENGHVAATQDLHQLSELKTVRSNNIIKPFPLIVLLTFLKDAWSIS